jgi:acetylornithine deacetylase/succinyl-diaminopimelate desuccinylase-like protein
VGFIFYVLNGGTSMKYTKNQLEQWCAAQFPEHLDLLKTLAAIPAPSHHEDLRAEFIRNWLVENGAKNVTIDAAKNVILPLGKGPYLVVMAHTDVAFPDTDALPVREEKDMLFAPGVGDDTANVTALMLCARFFIRNPDLLPESLLIVFNSCEEGLGNLKGVRQIMTDYAGCISALVSFDCQSNAIIARAVGSERWKVTVSTKGGHSFSDFGNPNAISHLSALVCRLYGQTVPQKEDCITTYNVGLISGGTSVNTIAQSAEMTYEYRSNDRSCLAVMAEQFRRILKESACAGVRISVENLGIRPCGGDVPEDLHQKLLTRCEDALTAVYPQTISFCAASTDANIPLSLGIPAATFGLYRGGGAHTRQEYVNIDSLTPGLKIAMNFFLHKMLSDESVDNGFRP